MNSNSTILALATARPIPNIEPPAGFVHCSSRTMPGRPLSQHPASQEKPIIDGFSFRPLKASAAKHKHITIPEYVLCLDPRALRFRFRSEERRVGRSVEVRV